jgi:glucose/arabinose dehydrogenase
MYCSSTIPLIALVILIVFLLSNYSIYSRYLFAHDIYATNVKAAVSSTGPTFTDPKLGDKYKNNIFVGDITKGNLYFFEVNENRTGLKFDNDNTGSSSSSGLLDKVADNKAEVAAITLATGFHGITDIKTGPDDLLYILTFDEKSHGEGKINRISSASGSNS